MDPKIVREGESSPVLCFRLLFVDSGRITTFAAVPTAIDKMDLSALSNVLTTSGGLSPDSTESPIVKRLDALERRVAELSAAVLRNSSVVRSDTDKFAKSYSNKYALLVGVDRVASGRLPALTSAASDAAAMGKILREKYAFQVYFLLNETATAANVNKMVNKLKSDFSGDDLIVIYYSGATTASRKLEDNGNTIGAPRELILSMFDFTSLDSGENITLNKLIDALREAKNTDRLIVIDGCDGTYGTSVSTLAPEKGVASENEFQVISASQDGEYAFEDKNGGFFTRSIIAQLDDSYSITDTQSYPSSNSPNPSFDKRQATTENDYDIGQFGYSSTEILGKG